MDLMADPSAAAVMAPMLEVIKRRFPRTTPRTQMRQREAISDEMNMAMMQYMPLRGAPELRRRNGVPGDAGSSSGSAEQSLFHLGGPVQGPPAIIIFHLEDFRHAIWFLTIKRKEYVIETPATPCHGSTIWAARSFFSLISNTAGGYCFYRDAKLQRILRYRYNNVPADVGGRFFYIKEEDKAPLEPHLPSRGSVAGQLPLPSWYGLHRF